MIPKFEKERRLINFCVLERYITIMSHNDQKWNLNMNKDRIIEPTIEIALSRWTLDSAKHKYYDIN